MGFSGLGGRWVPGRGRDPGWSETLCHFNRRPTCSRIICKSHLCPAPAGLGPIRQVSQAREEVCLRRSRRLAGVGAPAPPGGGVLHPSLDLLQVLRPEGGRQQLLDGPDDIGPIRLGHVDGPGGAKLEKRRS